MLPGSRPTLALARELGASAKQVGLAWTVTDVRHRLAEDGLGVLAEDLLHAVPGQRRRHLLLVVDQLEELLTQTGPEERVRFAELLQGALDGPVQVVATLRPEFFDRLLASPELSALPTRTHALRPLRPEALRAVIEGPADRADITIDDDLVTRLVSDTGGGEALPLLAYALAQLTDGVQHGGRLSAARYEQLGEVRGVLAGQADGALAAAVATGGRAPDQIVKELLRLVTVDEQGRPTRWRVRRDEIPDSVLAELKPFVDRRLLTTDTEDDHIVLGVAHEAFLSAWPPLNEAITAAASALRARRQVEQATVRWIEDSHAPTRLWERGQLAAALSDTGLRLQSDRRALKAAPAENESVPERRSPFRWRRQRVVVTDRVELSAHARDFLAASIRRDRRRRRGAITVLSVLLVLALGAAVFAVGQQHAAEERQRLATARLLLTQAETTLGRDPRTALRLNEAAVGIHEDPDTEWALVRNLLTTPYAGALPGQNSPVSAVAFAPDRPILATGGAAGAVLWDMADPASPRQLGPPLTGHTGGVDDVAFAPDRPILATAGTEDSTVILWDITDPASPRQLAPPLTGHTGGVFALAFAPSRHLLATAGTEDSTVILWDITDPTAPLRRASPAIGHSSAVDVAFTPDGHTLATTRSDLDGSFVVLWDISDPAAPQPLGSPMTGYKGIVRLEFAPIGHVLAAADGFSTVRLWDVTDPGAPRQLGSPLPGHSGAVDVAFAPDGHTLATAGYDDNYVLLWNTINPAAPQRLGSPLIGYTGGVQKAAFARDGHTLATASPAGTVMWNMGDPAAPQVGSVATSHAGGVYAAAFTPDGHTAATSGLEDGAVFLWAIDDPASPQRVRSPLQPAGGADRLDFAPNRPILATGGTEGTLLWDITNPAAPRQLAPPLTGHTDAVFSLAFDPDRPILATASAYDPTVILWDITDPAAPRQLAPPLTGHTRGVDEVAFAPDGRTLATASAHDHTVILWDITDPAAPRQLAPPLTGHTGDINEVTFAPDGHIMATGGADGTLLWDISDPTAPKQLGPPLTGHTGVVALTFTADGRILTTVTHDDDAIALRDLSRLQRLQAHLMARACAITGGGLSRSEWARYVPGLNYVDVCRT
jgi:WD40 repeat protein